MGVAWAALVVSLVSLVWQAATWWHREWRRVGVSAVVFLGPDPEASEGLAYRIGVRVTNRGRPTVRLRTTGFYWSPSGPGEAKGHTWAPEEATLESGASHLGHTQPAEGHWMLRPDGQREYLVRQPVVAWAQLDSGHFVEAKPGFVLESTARFPIELLDPVIYCRAEGKLETLLRVWLGVERRRLVETPNLRARFADTIDPNTLEGGGRGE